MRSPLQWLRSLDEVRTLAGRRYPSYVYSPGPVPLTGGEVPAFMFHTIRAVEFEAQLRYLAENGYQTATLEDFYRFLAERKPLPPSSVLLTFDDVERGLLSTGVPLLKKYGLRCTAFLAPGRIEEAEKKARPAAGKAWPSWHDVREMADSGVVDIGSHTLNHAAVFVRDQPADFVRPGIFVDGLGLDNPMVRRGGRDVFLEELGAPVFPSASRMGGRPRYFDDENARAECIRFVEQQGGEAFFNDTGWRRRLTDHWRSIAAARDVGGRWETAEEQREAIRRELTDSRQMLEERIGRPVLDLAYPWGAGSDLAAELSRAAGYRTNFWGPLRGVRINRPGQDPFRVARIKEDYLYRLPGRGRKTLLDVLLIKARRRRERDDIY